MLLSALLSTACFRRIILAIPASPSITSPVSVWGPSLKTCVSFSKICRSLRFPVFRRQKPSQIVKASAHIRLTPHTRARHIPGRTRDRARGHEPHRAGKRARTAAHGVAVLPALVHAQSRHHVTTAHPLEADSRPVQYPHLALDRTVSVVAGLLHHAAASPLPFVVEFGLTLARRLGPSAPHAAAVILLRLHLAVHLVHAHHRRASVQSAAAAIRQVRLLRVVEVARRRAG